MKIIKWFNFKGRIRRTDYLLANLVFAFFYLIFTQLLPELDGFSLSVWVLVLGLFIFSQTTKRLHDFGYSGWYSLIPFMSIIALITDSQPGENKYGPNPKGIDENLNDKGNTHTIFSGSKKGDGVFEYNSSGRF